MSVPRILKEEVLDLLRDLQRGQERAPLVHELREHAVRAALVYLAQPPEDGELVVGHSHIGRYDGERDQWGRQSNSPRLLARKSR